MVPPKDSSNVICLIICCFVIVAPCCSGIKVDLLQVEPSNEDNTAHSNNTIECEVISGGIRCNGVRYVQGEQEDEFPTPLFWIDLGVSAALVCVAGNLPLPLAKGLCFQFILSFDDDAHMLDMDCWS